MLTLISDPVAACAFVNGVTSWLGFPATALPKCAACGGRGWVMAGSRPLGVDCTYSVACDACGGSGRVSLPEGQSTVLVASTSATPEWGDISPHLIRYFEKRYYLLENGKPGERFSHRIHFGSVCGTATIEWVPIISGYDLTGDFDRPIVMIDHDGLMHYGPLLSSGEDISSALAFSSFPVGGFAVRLIDFTPSVEMGKLYEGGAGATSSPFTTIACPVSFDAPVESCVLDLDVTDLTA